MAQRAKFASTPKTLNLHMEPLPLPAHLFGFRTCRAALALWLSGAAFVRLLVLLLCSQNLRLRTTGVTTIEKIGTVPADIRTPMLCSVAE